MNSSRSPKLVWQPLSSLPQPASPPAMPLFTDHATININARRVRCPEAGCEWCGDAHQGGAGGSFLSLPAYPPEAAPAWTLSQRSTSPPFPASPVFSSTRLAPGGNLGSFGSPNAGRTSATFLSSFASSSGSLFSSSVYSHASVVTSPPPFPGYQGMLYPFTQLNPLGSQRSRFRTPSSAGAYRVP
jgi:hypothetical protein